MIASFYLVFDQKNKNSNKILKMLYKTIDKIVFDINFKYFLFY